MGFRNGAFAKVWEVTPVSGTNTKMRISISRKLKDSDEFEQDFSGFVSCIGSAAASKALSIKPGSTIKLGDVDVSTKYDKDKGREYVNYKIFSFDVSQGRNGGASSGGAEPQPKALDGDIDGGDLPY